MTRGDWRWGLIGLFTVILLSAGAKLGVAALVSEVRLHPTFMHVEPLTPDRYWILACWLPFWALNIMGEEILWHGVMLPRQEVSFGSWAWLVSGIGWLCFHIAFGWQILFLLWPTVFVIPYIVQRRKNTWLGVLIHAGVNGPGFLAVAFGLV